MATPYRRDARGAAAEKRGPLPYYKPARPSQSAGFCVAIIKMIACGLGLAFVAGTAMGAVQTLRGSTGDASETAAVVSQAVSRALNTPAYLALTAFDLSNGQADTLMTVSAYAAMPFQTFAFAGGYAGCTTVLLMQAVVPSWTFRF
jgi:hypothetical protein